MNKLFFILLFCVNQLIICMQPQESLVKTYPIVYSIVTQKGFGELKGKVELTSILTNFDDIITELPDYKIADKLRENCSKTWFSAAANFYFGENPEVESSRQIKSRARRLLPRAIEIACDRNIDEPRHIVIVLTPIKKIKSAKLAAVYLEKLFKKSFPQFVKKIKKENLLTKEEYVQSKYFSDDIEKDVKAINEYLQEAQKEAIYEHTLKIDEPKPIQRIVTPPQEQSRFARLREFFEKYWTEKTKKLLLLSVGGSAVLGLGYWLGRRSSHH
jgi:hypothetical protein